MYDKYSLQEVIDECKKCRILCMYCHIFHSQFQRKVGLFKKDR
jgi:hypothetical protein